MKKLFENHKLYICTRFAASLTVIIIASGCIWLHLVLLVVDVTVNFVHENKARVIWIFSRMLFWVWDFRYGPLSQSLPLNLCAYQSCLMLLLR